MKLKAWKDKVIWEGKINKEIEANRDFVRETIARSAILFNALQESVAKRSLGLYRKRYTDIDRSQFIAKIYKILDRHYILESRRTRGFNYPCNLRAEINEYCPKLEQDFLYPMAFSIASLGMATHRSLLSSLPPKDVSTFMSALGNRWWIEQNGINDHDVFLLPFRRLNILNTSSKKEYGILFCKIMPNLKLISDHFFNEFMDFIDTKTHNLSMGTLPDISWNTPLKDLPLDWRPSLTGETVEEWVGQLREIYAEDFKEEGFEDTYMSAYLDSIIAPSP
jgi:hypothetical protein